MKKYFDKIGDSVGMLLALFLCIFVATGRALGWWEAGTDTGPLVLFGMSVLTQGNTIQDIVKWEADNLHSREVVTVLAGQDLTIGAVLGKILRSTPTTGTAGAGNTGSGTCTGVAAGTKTKIGTYTLTALSATAFAVKDPDGLALPDAAVGTAYVNDNINFTINDGSPDFVAGDTFTVAVTAGSGSVKAIDFDAVDGSADAYGILYAAVDATNGALSGVAYVRDANISASNLVWPTTSPAVSAAQKAAALAQLKAKGIVEMTEG